MICLEHPLMHRNVAGSIPREDTYLGCGRDPQLGSIQEATNQCFSLQLMFLSLFLLLQKQLKKKDPYPQVQIKNKFIPSALESQL